MCSDRGVRWSGQSGPTGRDHRARSPGEITAHRPRSPGGITTGRPRSPGPRSSKAEITGIQYNHAAVCGDLLRRATQPTATQSKPPCHGLAWRSAHPPISPLLYPLPPSNFYIYFTPPVFAPNLDPVTLITRIIAHTNKVKAETVRYLSPLCRLLVLLCILLSV